MAPSTSFPNCTPRWKRCGYLLSTASLPTRERASIERELRGLEAELRTVQAEEGKDGPENPD